jgi:hypothetical protein
MSEPRTAEAIEAELMSLTPGEQHLDDDSSNSDSQSPAEQLEAELAAAESTASRQGWVPRESYKGDPKKWVDAKTFVERGERFVGNLQSEVAALRTKLESFEGTKAAFVKFHEESLAKKDSELKEAIAELRIQRSQAQSDGEHDTVIQIEDRIELLKEQQTELKKPIDAPAPAAAKVVELNNPVMLEWIDDGNQWFNDEPKLRDYAVALGDALISNGETARGRPFLDKISAQMKIDFPRRFKAAGSASDTLGNAVNGAGNGGGERPAGGKTERDLPPEDFQLMKQFIREGYTTKETFLASYFSRNK